MSSHCNAMGRKKKKKIIFRSVKKVGNVSWDRENSLGQRAVLNLGMLGEQA